MATTKITTRTTVGAFLKGQGVTVTVQVPAVQAFVDRLAGVAQSVADTVIAQAQAEGKKPPLIRVEHVEAAFKLLLESGGPSSTALDPAGLFRRLGELPPEQIAQFIGLIEAWLATQPK